MSRGFFSGSSILQAASVASLSPRCGECGLLGSCLTPKMPPTGEGRRGILVVAEAPGEEEDKKGVQLVGKSGKLLRSILSDIGVDLDRDCWKTNALICRPENNETPTDSQVECCRPNLLRCIRELEPRIIILLGGSAVRSLIGYLWRRADVGAVSRWVGWKIPSQALNAWICPTYHPAYLLRTGDRAAEIWTRRHIEAACSLQARPWETIPRYLDEIEVLQDRDVVEAAVRSFIGDGGPVAVDYETNMLKPDCGDARIVSCAICWRGRRTISFPWTGGPDSGVVRAVGDLLAAPNPKIGQNIKFEDRWTIKEFGCPVHNWVWDTMVSSHILDNRSGITSLKFQAFVRLGQEAYDIHISPYFESAGSNEKNRIHEVELRDLLLYGGLDALLTYRLASVQRREFADDCGAEC